jgi:hypothetical protein
LTSAAFFGVGRLGDANEVEGAGSKGVSGAMASMSSSDVLVFDASVSFAKRYSSSSAEVAFAGWAAGRLILNVW